MSGAIPPLSQYPSHPYLYLIVLYAIGVHISALNLFWIFTCAQTPRLEGLPRIDLSSIYFELQ